MERDGGRGRSILSAAGSMILALAAAALPASPARADDTKGLWFAGGAMGFHETGDAARNNASLRGDPRPDDFDSRETSIADGVAFSISVGYGLTDRFSLQIDVGWFEGDIGPVDVYLAGGYPYSSNPSNPTVLNSFRDRESSIPIQAGTITEIPVSLTGVFRFRKDRKLNPYLGGGVGMIFNEIRGGDVDDLNERIDRMRIIWLSDERGRDLTPAAYESLKAAGRVPLTHPLNVTVEDAREFHLVSGFEYFLGDRVSLTADLRYTFADRDVVIELSGEDQVNFHAWSEELFRPDGSLRYFRHSGGFPNPYIDPANPANGIISCPVNTVGDFDQDGHGGDICYDGRLGDPKSVLIVQGGTIDLSGFSASVGLRIHF